MNRYGVLARDHWARYAPRRLAALPDPTTFFTELGLLVEAQVSALTVILAGSDDSSETYLQKAARLMAARMTAEEVVMTQLVWITDPGLPLDLAREEWEQTRPSDENLIAWAERMQDSPDSMPSTEELQELADRWALPTEFLQELAVTEPPRDFMRRNRAVLEEAATIRFLRELR